MDTNHLLPALLTAGLVYWLYENPRSCAPVLPKALASDETLSVAQQLKHDLGQLIDRYYQKHLYPHAYPRVDFVIPSTHSVTHDHQEVHVMIRDPATHELFDYNTLLQVGAHECAHALCHSADGGDHGPAFVEVLQRLDLIGAEMKLYDATLAIPKRYKQLCG
jgi:hypothetical protein